MYKCTEFRIPGPGRAELSFTGEDGKKQTATVYDFECAGVLQGLYNKDSSIRSFARSCFNYALDKKQDLWFGAKDTISKKYDHTFKDIFQEVYDAEYKEKFEAAGITYFYSLIDDIVARVIRRPRAALSGPARTTTATPSSPGPAPCASGVSWTTCLS